MKTVYLTLVRCHRDGPNKWPIEWEDSKHTINPISSVPATPLVVLGFVGDLSPGLTVLSSVLLFRRKYKR